ncbi:unnamed protein product [Rangifer tarandus platyrhynchus]|uniref:Uncharacterized protein n=2 Tax=Rangifer tarandus platyrhynchus TaxID=3082113 RepID=A0ABN8YVZ0_RANTA|nr:unnamed protein product [Rangifer tarandus platyrhynchus]
MVSLKFPKHEFPYLYNGVVVQLLSCVRLFATSWTAACQASLSCTISWSLFKLVSIESVIPSNHLILCRPLLLLPSIFPSIGTFSNELALHIRWPKYWSFSFSPSNEYSRLIAFRIDWFDLLAVQGTLKRLLQHHSSKALNKSKMMLPAWSDRGMAEPRPEEVQGESPPSTRIPHPTRKSGPENPLDLFP